MTSVITIFSFLFRGGFEPPKHSRWVRLQCMWFVSYCFFYYIIYVFSKNSMTDFSTFFLHSIINDSSNSFCTHIAIIINVMKPIQNTEEKILKNK